MDKPKVGIIYTLANGKRIQIDVTIEVKELLEQTDRQNRSQMRKDRRHLSFVESMDELDTLPTLPQDDTAALVIKMDNCRRLYTAINKLPELQKRRLLLYFFNEMNFRQIAELEGVSIATIARTVERALDTLKKTIN